jgi:hypothetical protein
MPSLGRQAENLLCLFEFYIANRSPTAIQSLANNLELRICQATVVSAVGPSIDDMALKAPLYDVGDICQYNFEVSRGGCVLTGARNVSGDTPEQVLLQQTQVLVTSTRIYLRKSLRVSRAKAVLRRISRLHESWDTLTRRDTTLNQLHRTRRTWPVERADVRNGFVESIPYEPHEHI